MMCFGVSTTNCSCYKLLLQAGTYSQMEGYCNSQRPEMTNKFSDLAEIQFAMHALSAFTSKKSFWASVGGFIQSISCLQV